MRLLLRFDNPTVGTIRSGGIDLRELGLKQWRAGIAWVPQHPTLFTGTIADNVRLGAPDAGTEQVRSAVTAAGLEDLVDQLPDGVETLIGDGGRRVSAGQRQRIALARAFLCDATLLILDEPTAHLDQGHAESIANPIQRIARGRTAFLIVHDEALAARADRIVRIAHGRVIDASDNAAPRRRLAAWVAA